MENNNKINLETIYSTVWNSINSTQKDFQVMSNIEYYLDNKLRDNNFISNFITLIKSKIIMVPLKLVNINVNTSFKEDLQKTELVTKNILQDLFNSKANIDYHFNSMGNSFPDYLEEEYNIKLDKTCDFALVYFQHSYKTDELISNIKEAFQEYNTKSNTYNDIKECIVKSNANYHKLINDKNKISSSIERYNEKLGKINEELFEIEESILNYRIIEDARDNFNSYKTNCFKSIFNIKELVLGTPTKGGEKVYFKSKWKPNNSYSIPTIDTSQINGTTITNNAIYDYVTQLYNTNNNINLNNLEDVLISPDEPTNEQPMPFDLDID
jgi:hypothetical protein